MGASDQIPGIIHCTDVTVEKRSAAHTFQLHIPTLTIHQGDKIALVGPSGCGKSTLLDLLSMVLPPTSAKRFTFSLAPNQRFDIAQAFRDDDQDGMARLRRKHMGYVLQTGGLLPFLSVRRNIRLSRDLLGLEDDGTIEALAETLGIDKQLDKHPATLSIGERQRVAIARALAHKPRVVLADEPTAALDPERSDRVMGQLMDLADQLNTTIIVASHDRERVARFGLSPLSYGFSQQQGGSVHRSIFSN